MFKKIRCFYWKKRDQGKGKQVKLFALIFLLSVILMGTCVGLKIYTWVNDSKMYAEEDSSLASAEDGNGGLGDINDIDEDIDSDDDEDDDIDDDELLDQWAKSSEMTREKIEEKLDLKNMDTFLGYMSEEAYDELLLQIYEVCKEKNETSVKRLDYQIVSEDAYLVTSFILLGDGSVYKTDYHMKNGTVVFVETGYTEEQVYELKVEEERVQQEALLKEQEEERQRLEAEKKAKEEEAKKISINLESGKTYNFSKKVKIKTGSVITSVKLNGKKIRVKENASSMKFKLKKFKKKLKKKKWNKLVIKTDAGGYMKIKFKVKK